MVEKITSVIHTLLALHSLDVLDSFKLGSRILTSSFRYLYKDKIQYFSVVETLKKNSPAVS